MVVKFLANSVAEALVFLSGATFKFFLFFYSEKWGNNFECDLKWLSEKPWDTQYFSRSETSFEELPSCVLV